MGPEFILANISLDISCSVPRSRAHAIMDQLDDVIKKAESRDGARTAAAARMNLTE